MATRLPGRVAAGFSAMYWLNLGTNDRVTRLDRFI